MGLTHPVSTEVHLDRFLEYHFGVLSVPDSRTVAGHGHAVFVNGRHGLATVGVELALESHVTLGEEVRCFGSRSACCNEQACKDRG